MKKLKIFGVAWHTAHQYELLKLPFVESYSVLIEPYKRGFSDRQRPMNDNPKLNYVPYYEKGKYDFAILHVDQQCIYQPDKGDRIAKGRIFFELKEQITDIPIIVINHMTPFHDKYSSAEVVEYFRNALGDLTMVCNSYQARKQWGWGEVITHGLEVDEWWDLPKEPRAVIVLSPAGMEKAYRRIFLRQTIQNLQELGVPFDWIGVTRRLFTSFDDYRDFLGRSLIYFNPTWQSPRPRARTEAMLSGCCVVTTPYQDANTFIKDGINGFLTRKEPSDDPRKMDNPIATAKLIKRLIFDEPELAIKVGQEGKKTARKLFNLSEFSLQWQNLLKNLNIL